jgi:20S proteasome alpha/beta subunit
LPISPELAFIGKTAILIPSIIERYTRMTLVLALQASDGVVLAGDNRGTFGDPRGFMAISDMRKKVFPLTQYCGTGVSGPPDLASTLLKYLRQQLTSQNASFIDEVVPISREVFRAQYNEWFQQFPMEKRPVMAVIVAGYEREGVPRIYMLSSEFDYAPMLSDSGFHILGLPLFPTYLVNRFYDLNASRENVAVLAEYLISETASQDPKVGGPITIAVITPYHGYRELETDEIAMIHQRNEEQSHRLREYFSGHP